MAVTGGVHTGEDAGRSIAAGAHAVQVVSVLIEHGPEHLRKIKEDLEHWMERHGYDSVSKLRGCMSMQNCPNTEAYERANYARVLQNLRP
jgi:dihydroorotate dehydrogenase (fumarate)